MLRVWSADELPGLTQANIMILDWECDPVNESRSTIVSLFCRKGMWPWVLSIARMHSLRASRDWLISAPSFFLLSLFDWVSWARSDPARSTNKSLPPSINWSPFASWMVIVQMACDREEVSLEAVAWVALTDAPYLIRSTISCASVACCSLIPTTWISFCLSSKI